MNLQATRILELRRVKNILDKLGAKDRTHAVTIGLTRGIIYL